MSNVPTLLSIAIDLETEEGHQFEYHKAVGASARLNGWRHAAAISATCQIKPLPPGWSACLEHGTYRFEGDLLGKPNNFFGLRRSLERAIRNEQLLSRGPLILFLEVFTEGQLLSLLLALLRVPRKNLSLWVLFRTRSNWHGWRRIVRHALVQSFEYVLGRESFRGLTDSELLRVAILREYDIAAHVMPIPHTEVWKHDCGTIAATPRMAIITAWWPGPPRPSKGLSIIQRLAMDQSNEATGLYLIAAKASGLRQIEGGCHIGLIADVLTRSEYLDWLHATDIVLLPYDASSYAEATSGIFVEAVVAGKIPFVSSGTWMAYELRRFGLVELIIDWNRQDVIREFCRLASDESVRLKVQAMQRNYFEYHSEASFAEHMKALVA